VEAHRVVRRRGFHIFKQSAHRWWWGFRTPFTPQEDSSYSFLLEAIVAAGRIRWTAKSNDLIGNRNRDLPVCSIVSQPTMLPRAPGWNTGMHAVCMGLDDRFHLGNWHKVVCLLTASPTSEVPSLFLARGRLSCFKCFKDFLNYFRRVLEWMACLTTVHASFLSFVDFIITMLLLNTL
jgi:hypothetical protein